VPILVMMNALAFFGLAFFGLHDDHDINAVTDDASIPSSSPLDSALVSLHRTTPSSMEKVVSGQLLGSSPRWSSQSEALCQLLSWGVVQEDSSSSCVCVVQAQIEFVGG
jgi:hypothetical protein